MRSKAAIQQNPEYRFALDLAWAFKRADIDSFLEELSAYNMTEWAAYMDILSDELPADQKPRKPRLPTVPDATPQTGGLVKRPDRPDVQGRTRAGLTAPPSPSALAEIEAEFS